MKCREFSLVPFGIAGRQIPLEITGHMKRSPAGLVIEYVLRGDLGDVVLPEQADMPSRRAGLWESTCFELFVAPKDERRYWEFNFSPAGHWNVYRFTAYREDMQEEVAFDSLPIVIRNGEEPIRLVAKVDLDRLFTPEREIEIGVSAVISHKSGGVTYWALAHPGAKADFHRRDGFAICV
ncbi:MAG: DOMON-like domain-containing protein [Chloroflexota bacterium]